MPATQRPTASSPPGDPGFPGGAIAAFIVTVLLEFSMLVMLFGAYSETMGMLSDVYLCDLPALGGIFCFIDEEMTVSHLLAFLLAVFSIAVPMAIWSEVLRQRIYEDPQTWLLKPSNRVFAFIALGIYAIVFLLETVNLYTLIARESMGGPFLTTNANPLMEFLAANQGLGIFVAALVAIVNTVLALLTVRAAHTLIDARKG